MAMTAELRPSFIKNRPGVEETQDNLKAYLTDVTRDNLHLMLCMSPLNPKFPERARRFPGLVSAPTIDWFLPWPEEALVAVSKGFLGKFEMACDDDIKNNVMTTMGMCLCRENFKLYFNSGSLAVVVSCYSLNTVEGIRETSCSSLSLSEGRGAEIARRD